MLLNKRIPFGHIIIKIKYELLYVFVIALVVFYLTSRYKLLLPDMPLTIPTFIGTAISILLSFKVNQSYDRWWEARKIWGSIVNDSRSFVLQLQQFVPPYNSDTIKRLGYRQIAWCYSLGQALRGKDATENLSRFLTVEDIATIVTHNNKPLAILQLQTKDIRMLADTGQIELFSQVQLDNTLVRFTTSMGKAERIKNTVFPVTYRKFLHFIIYLFVITLSISLKNTPSYFEIPLLLVLSSAFFLLEKTSTEMQDPFENRPTDTAVTSIATTIEINIKQLLNEQDIPGANKPDDYYLM